jgi:hypothetical protein
LSTNPDYTKHKQNRNYKHTLSIQICRNLQNCCASSLTPLKYQPHQHHPVNIPKNLSPSKTNHTARPDHKSPKAALPIHLIAHPNPKNFTAVSPNPKPARPSSVSPDKPPPTPLPHLETETLFKTLKRLRKKSCLPVFPSADLPRKTPLVQHPYPKQTEEHTTVARLMKNIYPPPAPCSPSPSLNLPNRWDCNPTPPFRLTTHDPTPPLIRHTQHQSHPLLPSHILMSQMNITSPRSYLQNH